MRTLRARFFSLPFDLLHLRPKVKIRKNLGVERLRQRIQEVGGDFGICLSHLVYPVFHYSGDMRGSTIRDAIVVDI